MELGCILWSIPVNKPTQSARPERPLPATPTFCVCAEPPASLENWPDDMHLHDGCRVYHTGKECATGQAELPLK